MDSQHIKDLIGRNFIFINLLLTKHIYETNVLLEIIQLTKVGQIYLSLLGQTDLLEQLKYIKILLQSEQIYLWS